MSTAPGPADARILRDAEVREVRVPLFVEQDVARLDVPMDDPLAVSRGEGPTDLIEQPGDPPRSRELSRRLGEVPAPDPAHDQVRPTRLTPVVVEGDDVCRLEAGDELCLGLEPTDELGVVRERGRIALMATSRGSCGCIAR